MHKVNQIVICKSNHNTKEEFENAIKDAITLLLDNNYIMTVRYDDNNKELGVVVIEYNPTEQEWGCPYPYWLKPNDVDKIEYIDEESNE